MVVDQVEPVWEAYTNAQKLLSNMLQQYNATRSDVPDRVFAKLEAVKTAPDAVTAQALYAKFDFSLFLVLVNKPQPTARTINKEVKLVEKATAAVVKAEHKGDFDKAEDLRRKAEQLANKIDPSTWQLQLIGLPTELRK